MAQELKSQTAFERTRIGPVEVLLVPRPDSGMIAARALFRRAAVDESESDHGLASFTTAMLMRGTRRRSSEQMAFDLESLGAQANESDGMDRCALSLQSSARVGHQALEILFEALREPAFDPHEHEICRQETLAHLRMIEDEKFGFTYREHLKNMFAGHGYGHPVEGQIEDVSALTPEDCRRWHAEAIRPETLMLVVGGDFAVDDMKNHLAGFLHGWDAEAPLRPRQQAEPPVHRPRHVELTKPELHQGFIVAGFRTPTVQHPDYPALRLASAALGEGFCGRMFTNLRDRRGLAYALGSKLSALRLAGHQVLFIGTKPDSIDEARDGLFEEAEAIRGHPLQPEDFERARQYVIGKYLMARQSLARRIGWLAWWEDVADNAALDAAFPDRLREVTPGDLQRAAEQWWRDPTVTILRPE